MPKPQACLPHSEKASKVIVYAFPVQLHSYQQSPTLGGPDPPATEGKITGREMLSFSDR